MQDTLQVVVDQGQKVLYFLMPQIVGGLIVPIVAILKKYVVYIGNEIPAEFVVGVLAIIAAVGLDALFPSGMSVEQLIRYALESVGTASVIYGGVRLARPKERSQG